MAPPKDKYKFALWIYPKTLQKVKEVYKKDNCRSKSEFIEKEIDFYTAHITVKDESKKYSPSTKNQHKLIEKILKDFPDSKDSFEYQDYKLNTTIENAREFITRAIEDNSCYLQDSKTYIDYIATRPRVEKFGIHGLFTNDRVEINLSKVLKELNNYKGNTWYY